MFCYDQHVELGMTGGNIWWSILWGYREGDISIDRVTAGPSESGQYTTVGQGNTQVASPQKYFEATKNQHTCFCGHIWPTAAIHSQNYKD